MKVCFEWGFRLSYVLAHYFGPINYRQRNGKASILGRISQWTADRCRRGTELWYSIGIRCELSDNWEFATFLIAGKARSNNPARYVGICPLPERRVELRGKYILFHDGASRSDRVLGAERMFDDFHKFRSPDIRTGSGLSNTKAANIDPVDRTQLPELFFAKHDEYIVYRFRLYLSTLLRKYLRETRYRDVASRQGGGIYDNPRVCGRRVRYKEIEPVHDLSEQRVE